MNIEIQNTPQNIVSLVTPKLKLLPEFFSDIVPATASGEKVGFMNTVGLPLPFIDVATEIVAQQDFNGYDHPWASGGNGIQQWDEEWENGKYSNVGEKISSTTQIRCKNAINVLPNEDYYIYIPSPTTTNGYFACYFYDEYDHFISSLTTGASTKSNGQVVTIPSGCYKMRFFVSASYGTTYNHDISINYPSTNHDYYPWANICPITGFNTGNIIVSPTENQGDGTTYIVAWHSEAGTVYGGEVDVTKGKLKVTWGVADLGDLAWVTFNGTTDTAGVYAMSSASISTLVKAPSSSSVLANIICSAYPSIPASEVYRRNLGISVNSAGVIRVYNPNYNQSDSPSAFKTAMDGVKLVYELATPVEYDITPVDAIKMLSGQNFVWSNTGDISVVYYKKVGVNDNVQTLMRSSAPSLGMERQEVEDRPLEDIRLGDGLIREVREPIDEREPIEREEIEDEPVEIAEEEPQEEEPVEEPQDEA